MKSAESFANMTSEVRADVQNRLRIWRRRLIWQRLLYTFATISVLMLIGNWLGTPLSTLLQQVLALGLVYFAQLWLSSKWRSLNADNFLQHLNRRFPDFEESAQLLIKDTSTLGSLQMLQRDRAMSVYQENLAQLERWQVPIVYRPVVLIFLSCSLLFLLTDQLGSLASRFLPASLMRPATVSSPDVTGGISGIAIRINPPVYTGLAERETGQLDIELPEGSLVEWDLDLDTHADEYALQLPDNRQVGLAEGNNGRLQASAKIDKTGLYRIISIDNGTQQSIGEIYSLTVNLDRPPDIRVVEPEVSVLEIPKNGPARFSSEVLVKDDYGVATVEIIASVAKGSGEGVKFRDEKLQFDHSTDTEKGLVYQKEWDLVALGMEPGDEVYFTVIATDNRIPKANTGRSETLIVRWLEDRSTGLAAEGLAIDFIPEFFKSQRQIIIDTEQLLEDEPHLPVQAFKNSSYQTGQAQADLKQKYGQYLGDEFGEDETPAETAAEPHDDSGEPADGHDGHEDSHGGATSTGDLNNMADVVRLFGHDHGDPDIGPITKRNPVALMKRAVNEMWQAERHLMQAEPALALPFEYEAYKYLKLARQADRIYVKRLGFEPPPVSEERRLSGELDDILSYHSSAPEPLIDPGGNQWNQQLLKAVYQILSAHSSGSMFNPDQRELLSRLSYEFINWSQQRAALIRHAASLETLALTGRLDSEACETCLEDLESIIWNLIEAGGGQFHHRNAVWYADDGLIKSYQHQLKQNGGRDEASMDASGDRR